MGKNLDLPSAIITISHVSSFSSGTVNHAETDEETEMSPIATSPPSMSSREGRKLELLDMPVEVKMIILQHHFRGRVIDLCDLHFLRRTGNLETVGGFKPFTIFEVMPLAGRSCCKKYPKISSNPFLLTLLWEARSALQALCEPCTDLRGGVRTLRHSATAHRLTQT
jgi:hypothetical protein